MTSLALEGTGKSDVLVSPPKAKEKQKKKKKNTKEETAVSRKESFSGAFARALVGTLAFVFRAPVRLFRPVKLSSWNLLEAMAKREGRGLSLRYLRILLKREKSTFLPHLLIPPLLMNTTIGFCLFEAYSLTENRLLSKYYPRKGTTSSTDALLPSKKDTSFTPLWIVALAGGAAGTAQCIVSAPLDNVRIIISSQIGKKKGQLQEANARHPLKISWRAVARAAILPFAPENKVRKLVDQVKDGNAEASKKMNTRLLWERRIKQWRGGVHGAGLVMSLARDSVGFSAFFVVFEISRRVAFKASLSIDRAIAWWNSTAILPASKRKRNEVENDDIFHLESLSPGDISYSQSRTKSGRIIAALVLVVGGAFGAAIYELVGRPAELMRIVIWEGRKAWEEGRRGTKRDAWQHEFGRSQIVGARKRSWDLFHGAGKEMSKGSFLELRSGTKNGTNLSRIASQILTRARKGPHQKSHSAKAVIGITKNTTEVRSTHKGKHDTERNKLKLKRSLHNEINKMPIPSLETRPGAYTLLLEHAQRTSVLRYTSAMSNRHRTRPTPVPTSILLLHTYFIAPFTTHPSPLTPLTNFNATPSESAIQNVKRGQLRNFISNLFRFKYPTSNAPGSVKSISQAQVWGSGRVAWAVRRLASPYAVGFLVFAWMSGDLT